MLRRLTVPIAVATVLVLGQLAYALLGGMSPMSSTDPMAVAAAAQESASVSSAQAAARMAAGGDVQPVVVPDGVDPATVSEAQGQVLTCGRELGPAAEHPTNRFGATRLSTNPTTYCPVAAGTPISQEYGTKSDTSPYGHSGMDFNGNTGDPVFSVSEGEVVYSTFNEGGYGDLVGIKRPDGVLFWYAHLDTRTVRVGAWVAAGRKIGTMGNTGASQGSHLHFEVAVGKGRGGAYGTPTDPRHLIFGKPAGTHVGWAASPPRWACDRYGGC